MNNKLLKRIINPRLILLDILNLKLCRNIPDHLFLKIKYRLRMGKNLHLSNPITFNEKIQWLKLYDRKPEYTRMVDKYEVRHYVKDVIGEEYLIPLLGVYNSFNDIDFEGLPNQFVLKPNHTSGDIFICLDKSQIDFVKLRKQVHRWLKRDYFWVHREWPYKNIKPRILCEKYLVDGSGNPPKDYKFMCFNGKVKCICVCSDRHSSDGLKIDFYDPDWNVMPVRRKMFPPSGKNNKPNNYQKMIDIAEKLSAGTIFLRVDLYDVDNKLYFGELTFYPASGYGEFEPESYDYLFGNWIELPTIQGKICSIKPNV